MYLSAVSEGLRDSINVLGHGDINFVSDICVNFL